MVETELDLAALTEAAGQRFKRINPELAERFPSALPTAIRGEDCLPLVIERGTKALTLALPTGQSVAVETP